MANNTNTSTNNKAPTVTMTSSSSSTSTSSFSLSSAMLLLLSFFQSIVSFIQTQMNIVMGTRIIQETSIIDVYAIPGMITILDTALYETYEHQLTATITSSNTLLITLLHIKYTCIKLLNTIQQFYSIDEMNKIYTFYSNNEEEQKLYKYQTIQNTSTIMTRYYNMEAFTQTCYEIVCDAIHRLITDRFADTANLPCDNTTNTTTTTNSSSNSVSDTATFIRDDSNNNSNNKNNKNHSKGKNTNNNTSKQNSSTNNNNNNNNNATSNNNSKSNARMTTFLESVNDTGRRSYRNEGNNYFVTSTYSDPIVGGTSSSSSSSSLLLRNIDCWESQRMYCPDYVWADDIATFIQQRMIRVLYKHPILISYLLHNNIDINNPTSRGNNSNTSANTTPITGNNDGDSMITYQNRTGKPSITFLPVMNTITEQEISKLLLLLTRDLPCKLIQFRNSIETEACTIHGSILKRLYLIKLEYRAPYRTFMESHQSMQRAPSIALVNETIHNVSKNKIESYRNMCKDQLQQLLIHPALIEALSLEKKCEEYELCITEMLYGFSELSRFIIEKRVCIIPPPSSSTFTESDDNNDDHVTKASDIKYNIRHIRETIHRLKSIHCRMSGPDTSTGIRPLLLDLQGIPRDEEVYDTSVLPSYFVTEKDFTSRLNLFIQQLRALHTMCCASSSSTSNNNNNGTVPHCFYRRDKKVEIDIPSSIIRDCNVLDDELLYCYCIDWYNMVQRQHVLSTEHTQFIQMSESIRTAEIQMSLATASHQSLDVVRLRLEAMEYDRDKRYMLLKEIVEHVTLREMNLRINILKPKQKDKVLALQPTTTSYGMFGNTLQIYNEPIPL